jgi:ribosomal-protein-alanine N-acetyltransferase
VSAPARLETDRLVLRQWRPADRAPFAALNADPEVMRHFPAPLSRAESDAFADRLEADIARRGWGLWALETAADGAFIGFTGLQPVSFAAAFAPAVEIGWRLARSAWGHGYATEAARAAAGFAFAELGLDELVSFTAATNARSIAVMQRIGMTRDPAEDFDHVRVPEGSPLRRHVLYRLRAGSRPSNSVATMRASWTPAAAGDASQTIGGPITAGSSRRSRA